ncbi:hypothetical protein KFL_009610020 [Klebsormidium nitens]|uniref:Retrovirus-related Pol polyprotein from transposon TNT 1-94-like beta-barrel domain-containing protein n=1 Tax=Klebsormidium nitens TaxID=105231 RepID=A0A1Y1IUA8_KLENI|nr:hypothetical protein KFL_009610020 [Klebsormidium nitens]|eukprot:GAQ92267.1 hypothetical protein KFL_009610020 [Klebsormidium nitens]
MQSGESVAAYRGRAQDLYRDLLAARSDVKPDDLSFSVLADLSSRFEGVGTVLTTTKEELGKVEELLSTLQVFEQRHGVFGERNSGPRVRQRRWPTWPRVATLPARTRVARERLPWLATGVESWGTLRESAGPGLDSQRSSNRGRSAVARTFSEGLPKEGGYRGLARVAFVVGERAETGRWIVDSGPSQRMTGVKSSFSTSEMLGPGTRAIKFGNKGFLEVARVGTMELRCGTPSEERVNLLREVAEVCEVYMDREVMLRAEENAKEISVICQPRATWEDTCLHVREGETPVLWHRRLEHAGYESFAKRVEERAVRVVGVKAETFQEEKPSCASFASWGSKPGSRFPWSRTPKRIRSHSSSCTWTCAAHAGDVKEGE